MHSYFNIRNTNSEKLKSVQPYQRLPLSNHHCAAFLSCMMIQEQFPPYQWNNFGHIINATLLKKTRSFINATLIKTIAMK